MESYQVKDAKKIIAAMIEAWLNTCPPQSTLEGGVDDVLDSLSDEFVTEWGALLQEELCPYQD